MKRVIGGLICFLVLFSWAAAEQLVVLPGGRYTVSVPDGMEYSEPVDGDYGVEAYVSPELEMDLISYTIGILPCLIAEYVIRGKQKKG